MSSLGFLGVKVASGSSSGAFPRLSTSEVTDFKIYYGRRDYWDLPVLKSCWIQLFFILDFISPYAVARSIAGIVTDEAIV